MAVARLPYSEGFNYSTLPSGTQDELRQAAHEIHENMERGFIAILNIGQALIHAKAQLLHGQWLDWLDKEFRWSVDTAQRYMNVARRLGPEFRNVAAFDPSAAYLLASRSVPDEVLEGVLSGAIPPTHDAVKRAIAAARGIAKIEARVVPAADPEPAPMAGMVERLLGALAEYIASHGDEGPTKQDIGQYVYEDITSYKEASQELVRATWFYWGEAICRAAKS